MAPKRTSGPVLQKPVTKKPVTKKPVPQKPVPKKPGGQLPKPLPLPAPTGPPLEPRGPSKVDQLTQEILQLHTTADKKCVIARAEIGEILQDLKDEVPHGQWMDHVKTELPYGSNTVQRAIRLHHFRDNHPERFDKIALGGIAKADVLIKRPLPELDALLADHHFVPSLGASKTVTQMTFDELMEIIKPPKSDDADDTLVRDAKRSSNKLIKLLGSLAKHRDSLDREDVVDLYDDLVHALAALAKAYDLEDD